MGLSVYGYKNISIVENPELDESGYPVNDGENTRFYRHPAYIDRYAGLEVNKVYTGEYLDGPSFSYGGYNTWRDQLAKMVGYPLKDYMHFSKSIRQSHCVECWEGKEGPFSEQINFSDCEGAMGPAVCKKLGNDYVAYAAQAEAIGGFFFKQYQKFMHVFDPTNENVAVAFG